MYEKVLGAHAVLGKEVFELVFEILKSDDMRSAELEFSLFEGEPENAWKMKIERMEE